MKRLLIAAAIITIVGCALKVDPVKVEGTIHHVVEIDHESVLNFTTEYCQQQYSDPSDRDECAARFLNYFWKAFDAGTQPSPTPSPSP